MPLHDPYCSSPSFPSLVLFFSAPLIRFPNARNAGTIKITITIPSIRIISKQKLVPALPKLACIVLSFCHGGQRFFLQKCCQAACTFFRFCDRTGAELDILRKSAPPAKLLICFPPPERRFSISLQVYNTYTYSQLSPVPVILLPFSETSLIVSSASSSIVIFYIRSG